MTSPAPSRYDALFFDFDGTLVDSEPLHFDCWREILLPFGVALTWADYERNCIGVSDRAMIAQLAAEVNLDFDRLYAEYPRKKELLRERMLAAPPMSLATRAILAKDFGVPLAVVSSSYRLEVEPVLEYLGLARYFTGMVFGDEVTNLKPHPEPYLEAARRLRVSRPLVFEDSEAGLASARAAGFDAIAVRRAEDLPSLLAPYALS
jgi:beta-phosphoglucomutase-like phosphatase (HAD superfamily)